MMMWFMVNILEGLTYIHAHNIIHADIKIENLVADTEAGSENPKIKICDFGLSLICD